MEEVKGVSTEAFLARQKEKAEEKVVPPGTWEGLVFSYNLIEQNEKTPIDWRDKQMYNVGIRFYDCPAYGESKSAWFKLTPDLLLTEKGKKSNKYNVAVDMAGFTGTCGESFETTLEQAKVTRLKYRISNFKPENKDEVYNVLNEVKAL
jgi:hypothetical protein